MISKTQAPHGSSEVRRWHRFRFDVPVRVLLRREGRKLEFTARGTGMNEGGVGLYMEAPLEAGDQVEVEFTPPYARLTIRVRGMVRNADANRCGVEFLAGDAAEQEQVALFRRMLRAAADCLNE